MHFKEAKTILSAHNGMNIYRGCTHGCIYCDSRSHCYNFDHDFEDIEVKTNAPELLQKALSGKRQKCMISTGSMSDSYIPLEKKLQHTRKCLEIINDYGFGLSILTKSADILRDLDLLKSINKKAKCVVQMTLTTYDETLCKILEPNVSTTYERFEVLQILKENGIPTVVWLGPILPYINDTESNLKGILDYCIQAKVHGILCFGMGVTLRAGDREYFYKNLDIHFPKLKEKYHNKYGKSYNVISDNNNTLMKIFVDTCTAHGILYSANEVFRYLNTYEKKPKGIQTSMF